MIAWIVFEDPQSLERIPLQGTEFVTPSSGLSKEYHEIRLEDIESLSKSQDYEEGYDFPIIPADSGVKVIGGRITRSGQSVSQFHELS